MQSHLKHMSLTAALMMIMNFVLTNEAAAMVLHVF